jgi:hypothetical protein
MNDFDIEIEHEHEYEYEYEYEQKILKVNELMILIATFEGD